MKVEVLKPGDANTRVYQFGARINEESRAKIWEQLFLAHKTYNDIIAEIRRIDEAALDWLQKKAGAEAGNLRDRINILTEEFKTAKAADDREDLKRVAEERRELWRKWYELMHAARKKHQDKLKDNFLKNIGERTECTTYQIRSAARQAGLGWATGNAALKAAIQAHRKQWPKFKLPNFKRNADTPRRVLELQFNLKGGIGIEDVFEDRHNEISISVGKAGRRAYADFRFRVGSGEARGDITGTVYFHRPLPPEGRVKYARLVEQRIGKDRRYYLQLVVTDIKTNMEEPPEKRKPLVALDFGWYYEDDGRRIAGFADASDPGKAEVFRLPPRIEALLQESEKRKSKRDLLRDKQVEELKSFKFKNPPEPIAEALAKIKQLPAQKIAPSRLARLTMEWRKNCPDFADDQHKKLEEWRKKDKILWQAESHLASHARNLRKKHYEALALKLAMNYENIVIDTPALAETAKVKDKTTGRHSELGGEARSGRVVASLYDFQQALVNAAARYGARVVKIQGRTSKTCSLCGGQAKTEKAADRLVSCDSCGSQIDRELNAAAVVWQEGMKRMEEINKQAVERKQEHEDVKAKRLERKSARLAARWRPRTSSAPQNAGESAELKKREVMRKKV